MSIIRKSKDKLMRNNTQKNTQKFYTHYYKCIITLLKKEYSKVLTRINCNFKSKLRVQPIYSHYKLIYIPYIPLIYPIYPLYTLYTPIYPIHPLYTQYTIYILYTPYIPYIPIIYPLIYPIQCIVYTPYIPNIPLIYPIYPRYHL